MKYLWNVFWHYFHGINEDEVEIVDILLHAGADANIKSESGFAPLQEAVFGGSSAEIGFPLRKG